MKLFGFQILKKSEAIQVQKMQSELTELRSTLTNPATWLLEAFGAKTNAGVTVNDRKALGLTPFWQGVRIISETIASLPIGLYDVADNGNISQLRQHSAHKLIAKSPSPFLTSYKFRETMQGIATVRGNAYAHIERDGAMKPIALHVLNPHYVTPFWSKGELWYRINGGQQLVHYMDMIHIRGINILNTLWNDEQRMGLVGESPIWTAKDSLSVGIAAQETEGSIMGNGGHVNGILTMPGKIDPADRREVEDSWQRRYTGTANTGKTPLLGGGMEYKRVALTPQESMMIESRKFSVEEVARILNIPSHKIGQLDRATFNNIEQLARDFYTQTIRPWAENWESELELKLLSEEEKRRGDKEFRFDFTDLLKGDSKTLGELIRSLFNVGIITINDGRRMMGMNVVEDDYANKHWIQLNMAEADNRPEPKPQGATPPPDDDGDENKSEPIFSKNGKYKGNEIAAN